jgi:hypothetical protein
MPGLLRIFLPVLAAAACSLSLNTFADTITLTNGKVLEGHAIEHGDTVTVELPQGTIRLDASQVKSIVRKDTPSQEFERRATEITKQANDGGVENAELIKSWSELARWAGDKQLTRNRADAYRKVIELDPDNAEAREALGFVAVNGKWLTIAERNQALGLVHFEGRWITADATNDIRLARDQERARKVDIDRAQAETDLKQAQAEKLEAERDLLRAQRDQLSQQVLPPPQQDPICIPVPAYGGLPLYRQPPPYGFGPVTVIPQPLVPIPVPTPRPPVAKPKPQTPNTIPAPIPNPGLPTPNVGIPTPPINYTPKDGTTAPGKNSPTATAPSGARDSGAVQSAP